MVIELEISRIHGLSSEFFVMPEGVGHRAGMSTGSIYTIPQIS